MYIKQWSVSTRERQGANLIYILDRNIPGC